MKGQSWILAGVGLVIGSATMPIDSVQAQSRCASGWVLVGGECRLPDDLVIGDQIEITIGSAVSRRGQVFGYAQCDGQRTYYTSASQQGCGWRNAITAYRRTNGGELGTETSAASALKVPK